LLQDAPAKVEQKIHAHNKLPIRIPTLDARSFFYTDSLVKPIAPHHKTHIIKGWIFPRSSPVRDMPPIMYLSPKIFIKLPAILGSTDSATASRAGAHDDHMIGSQAASIPSHRLRSDRRRPIGKSTRDFEASKKLGKRFSLAQTISRPESTLSQEQEKGHRWIFARKLRK